MAKKIFATWSIVLLLIQFTVSARTIENDSKLDKIYLGISGGLCYIEIGYSRFAFRLGSNILYNWSYNYLSFSYSRLSVWDFKFGDHRSNYGDSRFHRFELCYGRIMVLHKSHPLFKKFHFGGSIGISYNNIKFFKDDIALSRNDPSTADEFGIPLGISISSSFDKFLYGGFEWKYHIISNYTPYGEINVFLMFNI